HQPAIANRLRCRIQAVVVALHDDAAADRDFAYWKPQSFGRLGGEGLDLAPRQGRAPPAPHIYARGCPHRAAPGFTEPGSVEDCKPDVRQGAAELGVESGSAGDEVEHLRSQQSVNFGEEKLA